MEFGVRSIFLSQKHMHAHNIFRFVKKFQTLISQICQFFLLKKCEKLLQLLSIFQQKISAYTKRAESQLTFIKFTETSNYWSVFLCFSLVTINWKYSYDSGILRQDYGIIRQDYGIIPGWLIGSPYG